MVKKIAIFVVVCGVAKLALAFLPDSMILASFCRIPAEVAAFYYGVPLEADMVLDARLSFTARGVTLAVTRSCAATDFFALVASVLLTARILRKGVDVRCFRGLFDLVFAWIITLVVNSLRIIALVPVDSIFPKDHAPIVHLLVGVAFFLPVFAFIWYYASKEVKR